MSDIGWGRYSNSSRYPAKSSTVISLYNASCLHVNLCRAKGWVWWSKIAWQSHDWHMILLSWWHVQLHFVSSCSSSLSSNFKSWAKWSTFDGQTFRSWSAKYNCADWSVLMAFSRQSSPPSCVVTSLKLLLATRVIWDLEYAKLT